MSTKTVTCVEITCDDCGQYVESDDGGALHFTTRDEALGHDWVQIGDLDICEPCQCKRICAEAGHHTWAEWVESTYEAGNVKRFRYCRVCSENEHELKDGRTVQTGNR